jgi:hypothetical protein
VFAAVILDMGHGEDGIISVVHENKEMVIKKQCPTSDPDSKRYYTEA